MANSKCCTLEFRRPRARAGRETAVCTTSANSSWKPPPVPLEPEPEQEEEEEEEEEQDQEDSQPEPEQEWEPESSEMDVAELQQIMMDAELPR